MKGEVKQWHTKEVFERHIVFKGNSIPAGRSVHATALPVLVGERIEGLHKMSIGPIKGFPKQLRGHYSPSQTRAKRVAPIEKPGAAIEHLRERVRKSFREMPKDANERQ